MIAVLSLVLGAIFAVAATGKLFNFASFRRVVRYTLRLDNDRAKLMAICIVAAEIVAASTGYAAVSEGPMWYADLTVIGVLVSAFTGWTIVVLRRHLVVSCPCFGGAATNVSWRTLLRNLAILALVVGTLVVGAGRNENPGIPQLFLATIVLAVCAGFAAYRFVRPHLLTPRRIRAVVDGTEGSL